MMRLVIRLFSSFFNISTYHLYFQITVLNFAYLNNRMAGDDFVIKITFVTGNVANNCQHFTKSSYSRRLNRLTDIGRSKHI